MDYYSGNIFYGYCFPEPDGWHTPAVTLTSAEEAIRYCQLHHTRFREIRITDPSDFLVMHVIDHVANVPQLDGTIKKYNLNRET